MYKYTKLMPDAFDHMIIDAGLIASDFNLQTGELDKTKILANTSGGLNFHDTIEYMDLGDDVDGCPKNMKELKRIKSRTVTLSGSEVTLTKAGFQRMIAHADVDGNKIVPRDEVKDSDFADLYFINNYSSVNNGAGAGFVVIHMFNCLNTGGFQIQTEDKGKGKYAVEYTAHYSMEAQDTPPYEAYLVEGVEGPFVQLSKSNEKVAVGSTVTLTVNKYPADAVVTWDSTDDDVATVSGGVVTGVAAGYAVITASITQSDVTYTDICTVTVTPAAA